jgi:hypothetical protein
MKPQMFCYDASEGLKKYLIQINCGICKQGARFGRVPNFFPYTYLWIKMDSSGWAEGFKLQFYIMIKGTK